MIVRTYDFGGWKLRTSKAWKDAIMVVQTLPGRLGETEVSIDRELAAEIIAEALNDPKSLLESVNKSQPSGLLRWGWRVGSRL